MTWIELIIHTTTAGSDAVSALLMDLGSSGTMTEDRADIPDPAKPHGIWEIIDPKLIENMPEDVLVHGWFESSQNFPQLQAALTAELQRLGSVHPEYGSLQPEFRSIPDENWGETWKLFYHPLRAGDHFVIKPSWERFDPLPGDRVIHLDPGMAFGSGYHDTTVLCLSLLEKYLQKGFSVTDVGTGSGILAIGAAMCGADSVLAIDIDPDAVRVAEENVRNNNVESRVHVCQGNLLDHVETVCDICVANIIADVILSLAAPLKNHIRPGGLFICSGVILERETEIRTALEKNGYEILETRRTEEWAAFCARRPV